MSSLSVHESSISNTSSPPFGLITQIVLFLIDIQEVGLSSYNVHTHLKDLLSQMTSHSSPPNSLKLPKKTLKLTLSDASRNKTYIAFEYSPIEWLQLNLPVGSKLRIKAGKIFKNTLFLTPENTFLVTQGPEKDFKEWLEEKVSSLKQSLNILSTPITSFHSSSSSDQTVRVDPQASRFLIEPPKPSELIPIAAPTSSTPLPPPPNPTSPSTFFNPVSHAIPTAPTTTFPTADFYPRSPPQPNIEVVDDWAGINFSDAQLNQYIDPDPPTLTLHELSTTSFKKVKVKAKISKTGTKVSYHPVTRALSIVVTLEDSTAKVAVYLETLKYKDVLVSSPRDPQFMVQLKSILKQHVNDTLVHIEKIEGEWTLA